MNNIIGSSLKEKEDFIRNRTILGIVIIWVTIVINFLLCICYVEELHYLFLFINIITDIVCFFLIFTYYTLVLSPLKRKTSIYKNALKSYKKITGEVKEISSNTQRYLGLDCYSITIRLKDKNYIYFISEDVKLNINDNVTLLLYDRIVVGVLDD